MAGSFESHPDAPISLTDALNIIADSYKSATDIETVGLDAAYGRILATDIIAPIAVPAADNSAVDGYAFRHGDLSGGETTLTIVGIAAAGHPYGQEVAAGQAVRIFTGAVLPPGADTIALQENVSVVGTSVTVPAGLRLGANRRLPARISQPAHASGLPANGWARPKSACWPRSGSAKFRYGCRSASRCFRPGMNCVTAPFRWPPDRFMIPTGLRCSQC
jgi:hypothetical protein